MGWQEPGKGHLEDSHGLLIYPRGDGLILHYVWLPFQIATIGLAADENPFGVVIGGIV
jgi:hypothetical protein